VPDISSGPITSEIGVRDTIATSSARNGSTSVAMS
jgi:hypothetical protein